MRSARPTHRGVIDRRTGQPVGPAVPIHPDDWPYGEILFSETLFSLRAAHSECDGFGLLAGEIMFPLSMAEAREFRVHFQVCRWPQPIS